MEEVAQQLRHLQQQLAQQHESQQQRLEQQQLQQQALQALQASNNQLSAKLVACQAEVDMLKSMSSGGSGGPAEPRCSAGSRRAGGEDSWQEGYLEELPGPH